MTAMYIPKDRLDNLVFKGWLCNLGKIWTTMGRNHIMVWIPWAKWCHASFIMVERRLEASICRGRSYTHDCLEKKQRKATALESYGKIITEKDPLPLQPCPNEKSLHAAAHLAVLVGGSVKDPCVNFNSFITLIITIAHPWDWAIEASMAVLQRSSERDGLLRIHNAFKLGLLALHLNYHIPHTVHVKTQPASINCRNHWLIGNELFFK